jgi:hypothetical protein
MLKRSYNLSFTMAISTNVLLLALSGSIAGQLTVKNYNGKAVVSKKIGPREKPATEKQEDNEDLFKAANEIVKERYADLQTRFEAQMRLKVPAGRSLYRAMLKEFYEKESAEYK